MDDLEHRLRASLDDRYRVERKIGEGGMAVVFRAEDAKHGRPVALKVLQPDLAADLGSQRFLQEIRITARLQHPHILPLYDSGSAGDLLFYVMPFVEGETLRERLVRESALPLADVLGIAREVADALAYAHRHDVLHRDIKPENILLAGGHAFVADFGIARAIDAADARNLTEAGAFVGTVMYMSPEQLQGAPLDERSDLYALGFVLFEALAGKPPFAATGLLSILASRLGGEAPALIGARGEVPEAVLAAVGKALAVDPADRYPTMTAFLDALPVAATTDPAIGIGTGAALPAGSAPSGDARAALPDRRLLAVLPFENLSPDPEQEFFSDGMTEEMIAQLGRIDPRRLGVIARASAMRYKRTSKDVGEIARELRAQYLLSGSVRHAAGRVRITTELVQAADRTQLWAESYERPLSDVFAIQSEVASEIAAALALELFPSREPARRTAPTRSIAAHEHYLRGRFAWNKRTEEGLRRAITFFQDAIELDARYAQAHAGLADACLVLGNFGAMPAEEVLARARSAAERALEIDPLLAEAHNSLAYLKVRCDWDWSGAEAGFRRAILLDPGYATAHHWYALLLVAQARFDEARAEIGRARELDPLSLIIRCAAAAIDLDDRRFDAAIAAFREILAIDPAFPSAHDYLGRTWLAMGRFDEAKAAYEEAIAHAGRNPGYLAALGHVLAVSGRREEAERIREELERMSGDRTVPHEELAFLYIGLGEHDRAFELLDRACDERSGWLVDLKVDPSFDRLRGDPRFDAILRRIGLAAP